MRTSDKSVFECQTCGHKSQRWLGKCPSCNEWDSFIEENISKSNTKSFTNSKAVSLVDIKEDKIDRFTSFDNELDLVLGGGIVPSSLVLIGGSPGVGKSTLLLKIASNIASCGKKTLYVTGEESVGQIKIRANRLKLNDENLYILNEISLENIISETKDKDYKLLIIDSIQTMYTEKLSSTPGSVSQVRDITFELMRFCKEKQVTVFIIGHITKDGNIAGPRVLEHMVDVVLYFEGQLYKNIRMLRSFKNRFGATSEVGVFEINNDGIFSAKDISSKFFSKTKEKPGSAITVIMEGSRPIIIEVQALVSESSLSNPKRSSTGFDTNRLNMLLALLEKKLDLPLNRYDVFINVTGGIKINETSADLAIIAAIISSFRDRSIAKTTVFLGEISLIGDVRDVFNIESRLKEAILQNFTKAVLAKKPNLKLNIKCFGIDEVSKIIDWM